MDWFPNNLAATQIPRPRPPITQTYRRVGGGGGFARGGQRLPKPELAPPPDEHPTQGYQRKAHYQPPPLVKKRRMKRSCSERELLVLILSMETSGDEGETLGHLRNCMNRRGESSMKIAFRNSSPICRPRVLRRVPP